MFEIGIHPVFSRDNFSISEPIKRCVERACTDGRSIAVTEHWCENDSDTDLQIIDTSTYEQMDDVLRLCSLWLELSLPFFCKVAFAKIITDPLDRQLVFDPSYTVMSTDTYKCRWLLKDLAGHIKIFTKDDPKNIKGAAAWHLYDIDCHKHRIVFAPDSQEVFDKSYQKLSERSKRASIFNFAHTLLHELTHAVFQRARVEVPLSLEDWLSWRHIKEPKFSTGDGSAELGQSWQLWAFGASAGRWRMWTKRDMMPLLITRCRSYKGMERLGMLRNVKLSGMSTPTPRRKSMPVLPSFNQYQLSRFRAFDIRYMTQDLTSIPGNQYINGEYRKTLLSALFEGSLGMSCAALYCREIGRQGVYEALRSKLVSVSIRDGAFAQFPKVYADIYKKSALVQACDISIIHGLEAPF